MILRFCELTSNDVRTGVPKVYIEKIQLLEPAYIANDFEMLEYIQGHLLAGPRG